MARIFEAVKQIEREIIENRRFLHQNAEFASDLPVTTKFVTEQLKDWGYAPKEICKSGIVATLGNGKGKTILLRADMDALPLKEESGLPFQSTTEYAHACGHDSHTAMLLGAAKILKQREAEINGTVKLMFQPDEEGIKGAEAMVKAGVLDGVDAAMAIHIMAQKESGKLFYKKGITSASCDGFLITIQGKGGHGAAPHQAVDPINIAAHTHLALQALISREVNPLEGTVLTICSIHGGSTQNIIPEQVTMKGTIRAYNKETRAHLVKRLVEVVESTAKTFNGSATVEFTMKTASVVCESQLVDDLVGYLAEEIGADALVEDDGGLSGSEDFSYLSDVVPSVFFLLGVGTQEEGYLYPLHHPKVVFNEDAYVVGSTAYATCAIEWLKKGND